MVFHQLFILWGLPLVLLPLVIHLLNRLRYRTVAWGAMPFLLAATRRSTRHARIRQWLLLALRMLALLLLVLALSRPQVGGWLGLAMGGPPDTILLLVDRSASMGAIDENGGVTRLQHGLQALAEAARQSGSPHLVAIDSVSLAPPEIVDSTRLPELPFAEITDTAADLPAMFEAAIGYLQVNRTGPTEIWLASDLQRSNWRPDRDRWSALAARLQALPQPVRVRLLSLDRELPGNGAVRIDRVSTFRQDDGRRLELSIRVLGLPPDTPPIPIELELDGNRTRLTVTPDGPQTVVQHLVRLGDKTSGGWGTVSLPADTNPRDNTAAFVYGPATALRTSIVGNDDRAAAYLALAAAPVPDADLTVTRLADDNYPSLDLERTALLVTLGLPPPDTDAAVLEYVRDGGILLAFPTGEGNGSFADLAWGEPEVGEDEDFPVATWNEADGPLANTLAGEPLPLAELAVTRRRPIPGAAETLAAFADGTPLLVRRYLGRGQVLLCATSPSPAWSTLAQGPVLVPMVQRLLHQGARRLTGAIDATCGAWEDTSPGQWEPFGGEATTGQVGLTVGAFYRQDRLLALNRPLAEDDPALLAPEEAAALFAGIPFHALREARTRERSLQSEIWRALLVAMLLALLGEGLLMQPAADRPREATA